MGRYRITCHWLLAVLGTAAGGSAGAVDLLDVYERALDTDPLWHQASAIRLANRESKTQALIGLLPLDISANKNFIGIGSDRSRPRRSSAQACRSTCSTGTAGWH